jgi:hypothetical protein
MKPEPSVPHDAGATRADVENAQRGLDVIEKAVSDRALTDRLRLGRPLADADRHLMDELWEWTFPAADTLNRLGYRPPPPAKELLDDTRDAVRRAGEPGQGASVLGHLTMLGVRLRRVLAERSVRLPPEIDLNALVESALDDPEIRPALAEAGIEPSSLNDDISLEAVLSGVRNQVDEIRAIDEELAADGKAHLQRSALEGQRGTAVERLNRELLERIRRQCRAAIERRTQDSYSTELAVEEAPGLAELSASEYGIPTQAATALERLTDRMPGGSIGIAGPRGIGKTTLIEAFCRPVERRSERPLVGIVVSAPTRYEGREFVLHLFGTLADEVITVLTGDERASGRRRASAREALGPGFVQRTLRDLALLSLAMAGVLLILAGTVDITLEPLLVAGVALALVAAVEFRTSVLAGLRGSGGRAVLTMPLSLGWFVPGAVLIVASLLWEGDALVEWGVLLLAATAVGLAIAWVVDQDAEAADAEREAAELPESRAQLLTAAHAALEEIEYQVTVARGWSRGARAQIGAGPAQAGVQAGQTGTRTLARAPMAFPELVARLRGFLRQATFSVDVRIGIDELDKMESDETAHQFLNEIKGVFGTPGCFFLVSVSEEAMSNFDRRGARLRDVFDSSFDEILHVTPLRFQESRDLIRQRVIGMPVPYLALCHVLSGGLPRDLIRVARAVVAAKPDARPGRMADITRTLIEREREARVRAISVVARGIQLEPQVSGLVRWASEVGHGPVTPPSLLGHCSQPQSFAAPAPVGLPAGAPEQDAQRQVESLFVELIGFCYFAATVLELFDDAMTRQRTLELLNAEPFTVSLEGLAFARAAMAANPRVGWGMLNELRAHWKKRPVAFPTAPRPTPPAAVPPTRGATETATAA